MIFPFTHVIVSFLDSTDLVAIGASGVMIELVTVALGRGLGVGVGSEIGVPINFT